MLLSLMFWLTASWTTHPFYYGPDLPYAFGWVVLALAGDGGLLVPRAVRELGAFITDDWPGTLRSQGGYRLRDSRLAVVEASPIRRQVLQAGALGAATIALASLAMPIRFLRPSGGDKALAAGGDPTIDPTGSPTTDPTTDPAGAPTQGPGSEAPGTTSPATPNALTVASIAKVDQRGAVAFRIPAAASSSLPAGDAGIIVKLANGTYVAYDATCTHEGCRVGWDAQDGVLLCPCHGAAFDPNDHGAVLGGPTNQPLFELPIIVDHQAGTITLRA